MNPSEKCLDLIECSEFVIEGLAKNGSLQKKRVVERNAINSKYDRSAVKKRLPAKTGWSGINSDVV
jgi:hypothetical protein